MRIRGLVLAIVLITVAAGCGNGESATGEKAPTTTAVAVGGIDLSKVKFEDDSKANQVTVNAIDNLYRAPYITVKAGEVITFRNDGRNEHNVIPVQAGAFKPIETDAFEPGTDTTLVIAKPGDYPYYCSLHGNKKGKGMVGAIRVLE